MLPGAKIHKHNRDPGTHSDRILKKHATQEQGGTTNFTSSFSLSGGSVIAWNSCLTITATDNNPVVLKLTDFVLSNGSLVTFDGSLDPRNVIFKVGDATAMSGASAFNGVLLANNSSVAFSGGSTAFGEVIGKSITLSGGSKIKPPKPSP